MDLCVRNGVVFNPDKFKFGRQDVNFAWFNVTDDGIRPTKKIPKAIADFPRPTNNTGPGRGLDQFNKLLTVLASRRKWHLFEIC